MTDDYKIQILMLEDNDSDAEMVLHALTRSGIDFEVHREEQRDTFLQSLTSYKPDIVISDYNLPGYNGRQAYIDMTQKGYHIPFILVTGSLPDDIAVDCLQTGIEDYIIKDRLSRLPEAVTGVLAKWRTEEEKKIALEKLVESEKRLRELNEQLEQKVKDRTAELSHANTILAHRNQEITDGINYARRIQKAFFNKPLDASKCFDGTFCLLMPKDIVSGDFFWHYDKDDNHFIAAVDCTGHGVPGALMSMIAHQFLNQVVMEHQCHEPAEILKMLDRKLVDSLHQHMFDMVRDGMDIAICRIDETKQLIHFAGALRPLFYYDSQLNEGRKLKEISGNKFAIGGLRSKEHDKEFTQTTIKYNKGDCIYLTSDGYYSQFNHFTGKKMMKTRLRNILGSVAGKNVEEQQLILKRYFNEWQGNTEQVDDVLVVGVKF